MPVGIGSHVSLGLAVVVCLVAIAACGSSTPSSHAGSGSYSQALRYSDCMRSYGVSNFPDPAPGGGFNVRGLGAEADSPAFLFAQKECAKLQPGGSTPPRITGEQQQQMIAKARCIRTHGVPDFPDPTFAANGLGVADNLPSSWNIEAPAVLKARKACAHIGIAIPGAGVAWFGPVS